MKCSENGQLKGLELAVSLDQRESLLCLSIDLCLCAKAMDGVLWSTGIPM